MVGGAVRAKDVDHVHEVITREGNMTAGAPFAGPWFESSTRSNTETPKGWVIVGVRNTRAG